MKLKRIFCNYCLYVASVIYANCAKGQNDTSNSDSLTKYSYTIFGVVEKSAQLDMGTCSFLKKNGNLFLITAKHVLYGCDSLSKKPIAKFKFASVYLSNSSGLIQFLIPTIIDSCLIDYKDPDLFVIRIDNKWLNNVNSIEQFIIPPLRDYGKLMIFGQGMKGDSTYLAFDKQHKIDIKEKSFTFYASPPVPDSNYVDSIHNFIETKQISVGTWMKGFSGAPIFLEDKQSKSWRFCGVFVQGLYPLSNELPGGLVVVKPNYILQSVDKYLK